MVKKTEVPSQPETSTYATNDLNLMAWLFAKGLKNLRAERNEKGSIYIYFEDADKCQELIRDYYSGAVVPAQLFVRSLEQAKDIVFGVKRRFE